MRRAFGCSLGRRGRKLAARGRANCSLSNELSQGSRRRAAHAVQCCAGAEASGLRRCRWRPPAALPREPQQPGGCRCRMREHDCPAEPGSQQRRPPPRPGSRQWHPGRRTGAGCRPCCLHPGWRRRRRRRRQGRRRQPPSRRWRCGQREAGWGWGWSQPGSQRWWRGLQGGGRGRGKVSGQGRREGRERRHAASSSPSTAQLAHNKQRRVSPAHLSRTRRLQQRWASPSRLHLRTPGPAALRTARRRRRRRRRRRQTRLGRRQSCRPAGPWRPSGSGVGWR